MTSIRYLRLIYIPVGIIGTVEDTFVHLKFIKMQSHSFYIPINIFMHCQKDRKSVV